MASVDEFVQSFHNLEGTTLGEKKKSLQKLFNKYKNAQPDIINQIIGQLKTTNYLEEAFKFELLLYYRRTDDLLNSLMIGDVIRASKIIRQCWFIEELLKKFSAEQIAKDLFPELSYSIRTKFLKRILVNCKDERVIDEIFDAIQANYGFKVAFTLLPGCSVDKIEGIIKNTKVSFSNSQLKLLFDKNRKLIEIHFNQLKEADVYFNYYKWTPFFNYIGIKDPVYLTKFSKDLDINCRNLGRSSTKKFVASQKNEMLKKPEDYTRFLRRDALVRKLGADFPTFFKNGLPKKISAFSYCDMNDLLKFYSKSKQYELFINSFQEKYKKNIWENVEYMDERLIELISDKGEREKWIKMLEHREKYLNYRPEVRMMCCSAAVPMSMEFDNEDYLGGSTAISDRKTVFNTLISTCKLDQNYDALTNILDSFCKRYRNSDVSILFNFLRSIYKELDMKKLTEVHWKYIYEIITIQIFKKQQIFTKIFIEYIKFQYLQQKPIEELVLLLLKQLPQNLLEIEYENDEFEKTMLKLYIKLLPQIDDKKNRLTVQTILKVMKWNKKHRNDIISIHDNSHILQSFKQMKDKERPDDQMLKAFKYMICRQNGTVKEMTELDEIYWTNYKVLRDGTITKWYTKYKPELVKLNIDKIGMMLKDKNVILSRNLLKYDHLNIPKEITEMCLNELKTAEPSKRERVIKILIVFMSSHDFTSFFQNNKPKFDKVDVEGGEEELMKLYEVQCALAKYAKLRIDARKQCPTLLEYCRGDVLASALRSLYSFFCRIPEKYLHSSLQVLGTKAVSVRKHSIFLSSLILPIVEVVLKYKQIQSDEKNKTIRQHMFFNCYSYFIKNNVEACWNILENYLETVTKEQKDVLKLLTKVYDVPKSYRGIYTELAWKILNNFKKDDVKIDDNMGDLLKNLKREDVMLLRKDFCMNIIENKLFNVDDLLLNAIVMNFTKKFLFYGKGNSEEKLEFIFKCIRVLKGESWDSPDKKMEVLKTVNKFCFFIFVTFCEDNKEKYDEKLVISFGELWRKEFTLYETFEEYLLIDFITMKLEYADDKESFAKAMNKLCSNIVGTYGNLIIPNLGRFFRSFLRRIWGKPSEEFELKLLEFLEHYLEIGSTNENYALVIELLQGHSFHGDEKEVYDRIISKLLTKNEIIKILTYGTFKNFELNF